jgi:porin
MILTGSSRTHAWMPALLALLAWAYAPCSGAGAFDASSPYLLGDWDGRRSAWAERGIEFDLGYTSELAHNARGGSARLTRYADQWTLGAKLDLDKRFGWRGAGLQIAVSERNGRDLGADARLGNSLLVQEIYGRGQTWWLSTFAYRQAWLDGALDWRVGKMPAGADFAAFSCDFQNLTFCGAQPGNLVGDYWLNWPVSPWATWIKLRAASGAYVQVGAYQVDPNYVDVRWARRNAWKPYVPGGTTGWLVPLEAGWTPAPGGRPGVYKLGAWRSSAAAPDLYEDVEHGSAAASGLPARMHGSRHGAYVSAQQQLTGAAAGGGLTVFLNAAVADRATSRTDRQVAAGLEYQGLAGRTDDAVGFALGTTHNNGRYRDAYVQRHGSDWQPDTRTHVGRGDEYVGELFYDWRPLRSVHLRPNLQYIRHPGGSAANDDALVLGLKTSVAF